MPPQVVPPMFRMLLEEIQWAIDDVKFSNILIYYDIFIFF